MSEERWVHLDVAVVMQETEKAFKVTLDDGSIHWLPKSQVSDWENYEPGDRNCTISVTEWIAKQKNLE